jgi:hypothetical protein
MTRRIDAAPNPETRLAIRQGTLDGVAGMQLLYDVTIVLHLANRSTCEDLAHILCHDDEPPIVAVMCEFRAEDARWLLRTDLGIRAPGSLTAVLLAARFVSSACERLGAEGQLAADVTAGPSALICDPSSLAPT